MSTPLLGWVFIAAAMALMIIAHIVKTVSLHHHKHHHSLARHHHFIELGSESEEFFIPGDKLNADKYDINDSDDF